MSNLAAFFTWQRRRLGWLLAWGAGSMVVGAGMAAGSAPELRQAGLQALAWGAIDAALAWSGRRTARRSIAAAPAHASNATLVAEARRFQTILAVNAGLDVLYILGGARLIRDQRAARRGMGWGILVQGAFLLAFDTLLAWDTARWQAHEARPE